MKKAEKKSGSRYDRMQYELCGNSGLKLPRISMGGWHNFSDFYQARSLVCESFDLGITHFDLANNYGPPPGMAEIQFGSILKGELAMHRDELIISTKAGHFMWDGPYGNGGSKKQLISSLDQSLKRLGVDYVDIFYSHRLDPETPLEETIGALDLAVRQGKALYAGISQYDAVATAKAARIMAEVNSSLLIHQCAYSMLNRWIEEEVLQQTADAGMGMIVFCPLAQGLLTDKYLDGIPENSRAASETGFLKKEAITPELVQRLKALNEIAQARGQSLARLALQWILRDPRITSILIGASRVSQIEENCKILSDPELEPEVIEKIEQILK